MPTYRTTANLQLRTPSGAVGEPPDGPGGMATLADDLDLMLGVGGAERAANLAAITAIPTARCFDGKLAYAADTKYLYRYTTAGTPGWRIWQTPWTAIAAFQSPVIVNVFGFPPSWKIAGGDVMLMGTISKTASANFADNDTLMTLPSLIAPTGGTVRFMAPGNAAAWAELQIAATTGVMTVQSCKATTPNLLSLDGWQYRLA